MKPRTSREQAVVMLRTPLRELRYGRLRMALDFYLPYRLFRLTLNDGKQAKELLMAIDAVTGKLDPYQFDEPPCNDELLSVETSCAAPTLIGEPEALKLLEEKLKREAYRKGFFKITDLKTSGDLIANFHLPYWVGVYERKGRAHLEVIDAVRGKFEGAKLREIAADWFSS